MSLENTNRPCAAWGQSSTWHWIWETLQHFRICEDLGLWNQITQKNFQRAHKLSCINGFYIGVQKKTKQLSTHFSDQINYHREVVVSGGNSCNSCWTHWRFVNIHTHCSLYVCAIAWITCAVAHTQAHLTCYLQTDICLDVPWIDVSWTSWNLWNDTEALGFKKSAPITD